MRTVTIKSVQVPFSKSPGMTVFDSDGVEITGVVSVRIADIDVDSEERLIKVTATLTYLDGRHEFVSVEKVDLERKQVPFPDVATSLGTQSEI